MIQRNSVNSVDRRFAADLSGPEYPGRARDASAVEAAKAVPGFFRAPTCAYAAVWVLLIDACFSGRTSRFSSQTAGTECRRLRPVFAASADAGLNELPEIVALTEGPVWRPSLFDPNHRRSLENPPFAIALFQNIFVMSRKTYGARLRFRVRINTEEVSIVGGPGKALELEVMTQRQMPRRKIVADHVGIGAPPPAGGLISSSEI